MGQSAERAGFAPGEAHHQSTRIRAFLLDVPRVLRHISCILHLQSRRSPFDVRHLRGPIYLMVADNSPVRITHLSDFLSSVNDLAGRASNELDPCW